MPTPYISLICNGFTESFMLETSILTLPRLLIVITVYVIESWLSNHYHSRLKFYVNLKIFVSLNFSKFGGNVICIVHYIGCKVN